MIARILIADDHKIVLDGLRSLLEKNAAVKVVGQASDGLSAVRLAADLAPDLVIMDISLPGLNGIDATRRILGANPRVKVIALSMHKDGRYIAEALKGGAMGYLLKESAFDELAAAIRAVMEGQCYLSASITDLVIKDYIRHLEESGSGVFTVLTARERRGPPVPLRRPLDKGDRGPPGGQRQDRGNLPGPDHGEARHPQRGRADQVRHPRGPDLPLAGTRPPAPAAALRFFEAGTSLFPDCEPVLPGPIFLITALGDRPHLSRRCSGCSTPATRVSCFSRPAWSCS